jgi:hypothetical protein
MTKIEGKKTAEILVSSFFDQEIAIYLSLGLLKGRLSYRRGLQLFYGSFCLLNSNPGNPIESVSG